MGWFSIPLAGIFYCLSLYAEYREQPRDAHDRVLAADSPLVARGLALTPVADRLALALATQLWRAAGYIGAPAFVREEVRGSIDIDAPTAIAGKPWIKRQTSRLRSLIYDVRHERPFSLLRLSERTSDAETQDPFDTFDYIEAQHRERQLGLDYFSLVGYGTALDPAWPRGHSAWEPFWRKLDPDARLGIHPSYWSSERPELLKDEVRILTEATRREVTISRQHYLRLRLPDTFRTLISAGITEDHSLMWAESAGFRTGSARSFPWYDLRAEETTQLVLFPPHAMDVTARYYGGLSPKQAVQSWRTIAGEARISGSALRSIWHNSNLGKLYGWGPWREAYEAALNLATRETPIG